MQKINFSTELTEEQIEAVNHIYGPALISACPGAGKTRVVIFRALNLVCNGIDPAKICMVTFTNKAAEEMKKRLETVFGKYGVAGWDKICVSTFHSLFAKLIRENFVKIPQGKKFTIYDEDDAVDLIRSIVSDMGGKIDAAEARILHGRICDIRENEDPSLSNLDRYLGDDASVAKSFIDSMRNIRALDFTALLHEPYLSIKNGNSSVGDIFDFVIVDEAQDTNFIQFELARMLSPHNNIMLVGDGDQSIYKWRGARPENLVKFINSGGRLIRLTRNYRCNPHVVSAASKLISCDKNRINSDIHAFKKSGSPVSWRMLLDREEEADWVAGQIWKGIQAGIRPSSICILIRANHLTRSLEIALNSRGIPYSVLGTRRFFDREEVRDALSILKFVYNNNDAISLMRFVNKPRRGIGQKVSKQIGDACYRQKSIMAIMADIQLSEMPNKTKDSICSVLDIITKHSNNIDGKKLQTIMEEMDYLTWLSTEHKEKMEEKWDNVKEFFKYFDECLAKGMSLHDILEKSTLSSPKDEEEKGVRIMSMHSSKGLEFNNVFICCCEDGVIPHRRSIEDDAGGIDEERRLFYVAMTRAEDRLVLTFSIFDSKMKKSPKKPSRFLFESQLVDTDDLQEQFQRIMS